MNQLIKIHLTSCVNNKLLKYVQWHLLLFIIIHTLTKFLKFLLPSVLSLQSKYFLFCRNQFRLTCHSWWCLSVYLKEGLTEIQSVSAYVSVWTIRCDGNTGLTGPTGFSPSQPNAVMKCAISSSCYSHCLMDFFGKRTVPLRQCFP